MSTPSIGPAPVKNPLVRTGDDAPATEGAGLFHDVREAVTGFADGNWAEGLLNLASAAGDVGKMLTDPLAYLVSAGFGWMFEHVSFLREPLDWLTGDQQTLDGMAQTWSSVSSYLDEISTDLKNAVDKDAGQWAGQDSARYREFGADRADTYGAVGTAARGMSILITICKTILKVVRDIVRDLITEAIGKLVSICLRWAPAMAALGAGIAGAVAEGVPVAVRYAQKCIEWCRKLTKAFGKAGGLFKKLDDVLANASVNLAKRGDDFVTVLKQAAKADLARKAQDFTVGAMLRDAGAGAKKVVVDGVTGLPKDIGPAMVEEFRKEGAKIVDNRGWKDWRELKAEEAEKEKQGR
ncbi:hypothetical protein SAMN05216553_10541 [Lentzea fradiae]|uniref:PPE family protein n=1 Tax=Lentzea fradiae TaxID=200378 RepID=A0A1G7R2G6_9PSEU|nr:hypothetical protein [Lentzea fradiae]SDG04329.1 hypothetical protein SAMN05216553_10541 [Lentzea fradiae]